MESLLHEAQAKAVPFLSSIVGNNTLITLMTAYHLAVSTLLDASGAGTGSFSFEASSFPGQDTFSNDQKYDDYIHRQQQAFDNAGNNDYSQHSPPRNLSVWQMASMGVYYIFSFIHSMVAQVLHAQFASSLSPSAISLISFVFTCLISLLLFRIAISIVLSIFYSVLWLFQTAIIMSLVAFAIWVVFNLTSSGSSSRATRGGDAASEAWDKEYARQQQEYKKMFKTR